MAKSSNVGETKAKSGIDKHPLSSKPGEGFVGRFDCRTGFVAGPGFSSGRRKTTNDKPVVKGVALQYGLFDDGVKFDMEVNADSHLWRALPGNREDSEVSSEKNAGLDKKEHGQ